MSEAIRPFANGSQFLDWQNANCCRCKKYSFACDPATGKTREPLDESEACQIELALCKSAWGDGTVSPEIAKRMGFPGPLEYSWRCGEVDWTDDWRVRCEQKRMDGREHLEMPEVQRG